MKNNTISPDKELSTAVRLRNGVSDMYGTNYHSHLSRATYERMFYQYRDAHHRELAAKPKLDK
jgi:hypothetical protein